METVDEDKLEQVRQENVEAIGNLLDMTLEQVEMSYDLDRQQETNKIKSSSQHVLD